MTDADDSPSPPRFSPAIDAILAAAPSMPLDAGTVDAALVQRLRSLDLAAIGHGLAAKACLAGMWLLANDLGSSHRLSQELHTPEGSFWHAIMHRREGDFGNAKYWFRRVGRHPVLESLAVDPFRFVDEVEHCVLRRDGNEAALVAIQQLEWETLFRFCWDLARSTI
jgi:hypothetical protein